MIYFHDLLKTKDTLRSVYLFFYCLVKSKHFRYFLYKIFLFYIFFLIYLSYFYIFFILLFLSSIYSFNILYLISFIIYISIFIYFLFFYSITTRFGAIEYTNSILLFPSSLFITDSFRSSWRHPTQRSGSGEITSISKDKGD